MKTFKNLFSKHKNVRDRFSYFYTNNTFGSKESVSGGGSTMEQTKLLRFVLPAIIKEYGIKTFIDAPCGDMNWIKEVEMEGTRYIGVDIVDTLIQNNTERFSSANRTFKCLNLIEDSLPTGDIIFCRDCLVHLTNEQAISVIRNFKKSGSKYLLTTTFISRKKNKDLIGDDIWRPLNLQISPFNLPEPVLLINENCTEGDYKFMDKCIGLWRLDEINL